MFGRQLRRIRPVPRDALGTDKKFVVRPGKIYLVQHELFDVDVWGFEGLLDEANRDTNKAADSLNRATDLYRGMVLRGA